MMMPVSSWLIKRALALRIVTADEAWTDCYAMELRQSFSPFTIKMKALISQAILIPWRVLFQVTAYECSTPAADNPQACQREWTHIVGTPPGCSSES